MEENMSIQEKNKHLVRYRLSCQIEAQMPNPNNDEVERQRMLAGQGFLEPMEDYPDRYKLTTKGSQELCKVFSDYRKNLRKMFMENREIRRGSQRIVKVSQIINNLGLNTLEKVLAEEWVNLFIRCLTREGFFAWWQPDYSEDWSEIWYYYSEHDEADFLAERRI